MFTIKYSRGGHDLQSYARDIYDATGISKRRYAIVALSQFGREDLYALTWTRRGAERAKARLTASAEAGFVLRMS